MRITNSTSPHVLRQLASLVTHLYILRFKILPLFHRYIPPECLPKRYGGHRESVSLERWLTKIKQYKNKDFDNDMRNLGYAVD